MEKHIANFLQAKINKGRNFIKMEGGGLANKDSFELVKEGIITFKFLVEKSEREGICIKWWDQQLFNTAHLTSHNKYFEWDKTHCFALYMIAMGVRRYKLHIWEFFLSFCLVFFCFYDINGSISGDMFVSRNKHIDLFLKNSCSGVLKLSKFKVTRVVNLKLVLTD